MQQAIEDFRMQIEAEFRRRARSGNDFAIEKGKIYKILEETNEKIKNLTQEQAITIQTIGCLIESMIIEG